MVNHSRYQRSRSLRVKVIDNSEQIIEKLDKLLLLVILPLLLQQLLMHFSKYYYDILTTFH